MNGKAVREAYTGQADEEMSYATLTYAACMRPSGAPTDRMMNR